MRLEINASAPVFKLNDVFGRAINLNDYKGKKVLIAFFRHAGCPFCNLRVHTLIKSYEELKSMGLEMIFFFESKEQIILRSSFHRDISPIPIISDPEKIWYDAYGLEPSAYKSAISHVLSLGSAAIKAKLKNLPVHMMAGGESINTIPAEFLLSEELIIRKLLYSKSLTDRMALEEIKVFAETKTPSNSQSSTE